MVVLHVCLPALFFFTFYTSVPTQNEVFQKIFPLICVHFFGGGGGVLKQLPQYCTADLHNLQDRANARYNAKAFIAGDDEFCAGNEHFGAGDNLSLVMMSFVLEMNTSVLETSTFATKDESFSTGDDRVKNARSSFSYTHS